MNTCGLVCRVEAFDTLYGSKIRIGTASLTGYNGKKVEVSESGRQKSDRGKGDV
mgnify:CR=1 FL=1